MNRLTFCEVYIHVGLGKAASTFLQYNVFPKLKGIYYIQRTRFRKSVRIVYRGKHKKYLISGELDNRIIENYLKEMTPALSHARPIVILRRHDSWIASQYKRYVKNGYPYLFHEFIDMENNRGYWKKEELYFMDEIRILETYFDYKPLVLFYDDLKKDPRKFVDRLVRYIGAGYNPDKINFSPRHRSYNTKQLKAVFRVSKCVNIKRHRDYRIDIFNHIRRFFVNIIRYSTLFIGRLLPDSLFSEAPLIPQENLNVIREYYTDDWNECIEYARLNNPAE